MAVEISNGRFVWPRAGSSNESFGGLYTECTTTPDITVVMISTVPWTLSSPSDRFV